MKIEYSGPTWNSARPKIKEKFAEVGLLDTCEVRYQGICDDYHLTFAHSLRRMYIATKEQMEEVVRACQKCHKELDAKKHEETYDEVRDIIARRILPVKSIYEKDSTHPGRLQSISDAVKDKAATAKERYNNNPRRKRIRYS